MPVQNYVHCQVTVDVNTIMVFGGCIPGNCYADVALKLNIADKKWKRLPNLPTGRHGPACGVIREQSVPKRAVVAGGHVKGSGIARIANVVEVLELSTLKWTRGPALPVRLHYHVGVPYQGTFYILGGHTGSVDVDTIYRYEPESGHWTLLPYRLSSPSNAIPAFIVNRRAFKK